MLKWLWIQVLGFIDALVAGLGILGILNGLKRPEAPSILCSMMAIIGSACVLWYGRRMLEYREIQRQKKSRN
jgi:hypothetical protein